VAVTCGYAPGSTAGLRKRYVSLRDSTGRFWNSCALDVRHGSAGYHEVTAAEPTADQALFP